MYECALLSALNVTHGTRGGGKGDDFPDVRPSECDVIKQNELEISSNKHVTGPDYFYTSNTSE